MGAVFVTGIGTEVGKTYVTAALIRALRGRGVAVDAFKPVLSGFDPATAAASDAGLLLEALGCPLDGLEAMSPFRYAAPLSPPLAAAREGRAVDFHAVVDACRARIGEGLLLIEGAGGVMSPLTDRHTMLDLIRALDVPVLLVAGTYLGAISHALTATEVLCGRRVLVAVSESAEPGASLDETCEALRTLGGVEVVAVPRGGDAEALADAL